VAYYMSGRGDYYRGDYYRAGGIFGSIGKFLGGVVKTATNLLPGPLGGIARAVVPLIGRTGGGLVNDPSAAIAAAARGIRRLRNPAQGTAIAPFPPGQFPILEPLPFGGLPGGAGGGFGGGGGFGMNGKRKRMNVANPRALRRALRRVAGFGKLAKRAKRDIARAASAIGVRRGGGGGSSRGVITRSEAARALRR